MRPGALNIISSKVWSSMLLPRRWNFLRLVALSLALASLVRGQTASTGALTGVTPDPPERFSRALPRGIKDRTLQRVAKTGHIVDNFARTLATLRKRNVPTLMRPYQVHDSAALRNFITEDNARNLIRFFAK